MHVEISAQDYENFGPFQVSKILAALAKKEGANLLLLGKQVRRSEREGLHSAQQPVQSWCHFPTLATLESRAVLSRSSCDRALSVVPSCAVCLH